MTNDSIQPKPYNTVYDAQSIKRCITPLFPQLAEAEVLFLQAGVNDTYLLTTANRKYIFRLYRYNLRSVQDIQFEIELLQYLVKEGVGVSQPLMHAQQDYMVPIHSPEGLRYGVMFSYAPGELISFQDDDGTMAELYGINLARFHQAQQGFSSKQQRIEMNVEYLVHQPMQNIRKLFVGQQDKLAVIEDTASFVLAEFEQLPAESLTQGICHGDSNCGNVHITSDQQLTFFDFDCCAKGWLEYDLATFYWAALFENKTERWQHFLHGYQTIRHHAEANQDAINILIAMRQLWLLGLHYESSLLHGRNWYNNSYFEINTQFLMVWKKRYMEQAL